MDIEPPLCDRSAKRYSTATAVLSEEDFRESFTLAFRNTGVKVQREFLLMAGVECLREPSATVHDPLQERISGRNKKSSRIWLFFTRTIFCDHLYQEDGAMVWRIRIWTDGPQRIRKDCQDERKKSAMIQFDVSVDDFIVMPNHVPEL